jgi:hypothetical protein
MKREVLNEEVDQIINQAFWQKGGIKLTESNQGQTDSETDEQVIAEDETQGEHSCPLCESKLSKPISDEALNEHLEAMLSIISEMENITDEDISAIQEAIDDELGDESDEDSDEDSEDDSEDSENQG